MIKIKEYLQLSFSKDLIYLQINPFEHYTISKTNFALNILEALSNPSGKEELINEIVNKFGYNVSEIEDTINDFILNGIVEENNIVISNKYERYKRQLLFFDILSNKQTTALNVINIQEKLKDAHIIIHGTGGIGNYVSLSLVACGVGKITLIDNDIIELSNLNRQVLFTEDDIGKSKVETAKKRLLQLNSSTIINTIDIFVNNQDEINSLYNKINIFDIIILSADSDKNLKNWLDNYRTYVDFNYGIIPCGYIGDVGAVGPLVDNFSKRYTELLPEDDDYIMTEKEKEIIRNQQNNFHPPSATFLNAIMSNIAALEAVKYIAKLDFSTLYNKRMYISSDNYKITIE